VQNQRTTPAIGVIAIIRFVLEITAFVVLAVWGFVTWPFPWNILVGVLAPVLAIVLWALFLSPKAVLRVDPFGKALIEMLIMFSAAFAFLQLGLWPVAIVFAVLAVVTGVLKGRSEISA
jgi:hypothetical protein